MANNNILKNIEKNIACKNIWSEILENEYVNRYWNLQFKTGQECPFELLKYVAMLISSERMHYRTNVMQIGFPTNRGKPVFVYCPNFPSTVDGLTTLSETSFVMTSN